MTTTNKKNGYQSHLEELGIEFDITDIGNADRFVSHFNKGFAYLEEEGQWIVFDGKRWTSSNASSAVYTLAEQSMKRIYDEARDCKNKRGQFELTNHARRSQNKAKIDPMIGLLKHRFAVSVKDFDVEPELINCRNGVLNLRTGELTPHNEEQRFRQITTVDYKPQADCPRWKKFLREAFISDDEVISYVQRALGYSLTGHTKEHKLFLAYGLGSNGKTTLIETVLEILGDYGRTSEFSSFLDTDKASVRASEAVGMLKGVRFATASETGSTKRWNEALVKKITGGDTLRGTKLHKDSFEFKPTHKLWFQANHLPGAKDASHGFWRRIVVLPFKAKFEGKSKTPGLKECFLQEEREGIFAWICEGARSYLAGGLGEMPKACLDATEAYRTEMDVISRFISERLEEAQGERVSVSDVHEEYVKWCQTQREDATPIRFFTDALVERGMTKHRLNKGWVILNKRMKPLYSEFRGTTIAVPFPSELENETGRKNERKETVKTVEEILEGWGAERRVDHK